MKKDVKRIQFIFNTKSWDPRNNYQIDILFFIWSKKVNLEFLYFIEIFILFKIKNALQWYFVNKIVLTYCEKKKNVLVIQKIFWNSRLKAENLRSLE